MQNIDKIAIALAVLILVAGFSISALMPDQGGDYSSAIDEANDKIEQSAAEQDLGDRTPPSVETTVKNAFSFQGDTVIPEWAFYRRPARLEFFKTEIVLPPSLMAARISTVKVNRDADTKNTQHLVAGRHAIFERAEIVSCTLEVKSGDDGAWEKLATVPSPVSGGDFMLVADGLEAGRSYSYRIVTRGVSTSSIAFAGGADLVSTEASGAILYPADFIWRVSGAQIGRLDSAGSLIPGRVTAQYSYWDWESGGTKRSTKIISEPAEGQVGKELFATGYHLERIQDTADGRVVVLKNATGNRLYLKNNEDPLPLDPAGWENMDNDPAVGTAETDGAEEQTNAEEASEPTEPVKPTRPRSSGGGLFGGDDR
ncbi:MAG: hypothetical protein AAEJ04_04290 [Planctomycetota bacterium]